MFNIIVYFAIFCLVIYFTFHGLVKLSSSIFLIDEHFLNNIEDLNENIFIKFMDPPEKKSRLNTYLRLDFLISLTLGIIWFIFPILLFQFSKEDLFLLPPDIPYLGQSLGIITLLTCIISLKTIKKESEQEKKLVLGTKLFCAVAILIIIFIYIFNMKRINYYSIISLFFICIWMSNSILGLQVTNQNNKLNNNLTN
jgi:hypothetical protein